MTSAASRLESVSCSWASAAFLLSAAICAALGAPPLTTPCDHHTTSLICQCFSNPAGCCDLAGQCAPCKYWAWQGHFCCTGIAELKELCFVGTLCKADLERCSLLLISQLQEACLQLCLHDC